MTATNILILVLAISLWGSVYWPVYLILRLFFIGQNRAELKSTTIALFWPVTVPLGLVLLTILGKRQ